MNVAISLLMPKWISINIGGFIPSMCSGCMYVISHIQNSLDISVLQFICAVLCASNVFNTHHCRWFPFTGFLLWAWQGKTHTGNSFFTSNNSMFMLFGVAAANWCVNVNSFLKTCRQLLQSDHDHICYLCKRSFQLYLLWVLAGFTEIQFVPALTLAASQGDWEAHQATGVSPQQGKAPILPTELWCHKYAF